MKITQEKKQFMPIEIILETQEEAVTFVNIIDDLDPADFLHKSEKDLIIKISDALGDPSLDIN